MATKSVDITVRVTMDVPADWKVEDIYLTKPDGKQFGIVVGLEHMEGQGRVRATDDSLGEVGCQIVNYFDTIIEEG